MDNITAYSRVISDMSDQLHRKHENAREGLILLTLTTNMAWVFAFAMCVCGLVDGVMFGLVVTMGCVCVVGAVMSGVAAVKMPASFFNTGWYYVMHMQDAQLMQYAGVLFDKNLSLVDLEALLCRKGMSPDIAAIVLSDVHNSTD